MIRTGSYGFARSALALALIVSISACSTTKQVSLGSPELSKMNVKARRTRSILTLADGRQMDVEALHVGVEEAEGQVWRERDLSHLDEGVAVPWSEVGPEPRELRLPSDEITRVELSTGSTAGAVGWAIGGGVLGGAAIGALAGGITAATNQCNIPPPFSCGDDAQRNVEPIINGFIGLAVGAVVFGIIGGLLGKRGRKYTYVVVPPQPTPQPHPAAPTPPQEP